MWRLAPRSRYRRGRSRPVVRSLGPTLWRRFAEDLVVTAVVAVVLGVLWFLLEQATRVSGVLAAYHGAWVAYDPYLRAAIGIVVGLLLMRAIGRLVSGYLREAGDPRHEAMVRLFFNILVAVVVVFYVALVAGVNLQSVFLGSALAGVVLGLASQTVLGNVFAGITIVLWGPFRNGDRIGVISASYGALAPSYPHETTYPAYVGTVTDIGLLYTVLQLDNGPIAKLPNAVLLQALVVNLSQTARRAQRVRMTFPRAVPVPTVEAAVAGLSSVPGLLAKDRPSPVLQVADVAPTTWDAVVVLWTSEPSEDRVRDAVLRAVLSGPAGAGAKP